MNDALKRAGRTALQAFIGALALLAVPQLTGIVSSVTGGDEIKIDMKMWQNILVAAVAAAVIALISWAQNALEDTGKIRKILK